MKKKVKLITLVTIITVIWAIVEIPSAVENNYKFITQSAGLSELSFVSGLINCNYKITGIEVYQDNTNTPIGTSVYNFSPLIGASLVNPSSLKQVDHYTLFPTVNCVNKAANGNNFISTNTISGSLQIYAKVMGTDGNYHVILNKIYALSPQSVQLGQTYQLGSFTVPASGISQYNTASGTTTSIIDFSNQPILTIASKLIDGSIQTSTWSNWADIRYIATVQNPTTTTTTTPIVISNPCKSGIVLNGNCVNPASSGSQITTADIKFAYSMTYSGDSGNFCGTGSTQGRDCLVSAQGSSSIPFTALNFIPSSTVSTNSLNSLSVQLLIYPKAPSLVLDSQNVGYTGTILFQGTNSQVISIPASLIHISPVTNPTVSIFAFGTAIINPSDLDNLMQQAGVKTGSTPIPVTISIYATGNFQGHGANGNFKGIVDGANLQLKTYYVSQATVSNTCTLTSDPCNKNICHDLSGNVISCYIPPANPANPPTICYLNAFDPNCATANPPSTPIPVCNSSDPNVSCGNPPDPQNPPVNPPCYGSCTPNPPTTTTTPTTNPSSPSTTIPTGQFFTTGLPTASATSTGASICPTTITASECATYLYSLVSVPSLNQNIFVVIIAILITIGVIIYVIKRRSNP